MVLHTMGVPRVVVARAPWGPHHLPALTCGNSGVGDAAPGLAGACVGLEPERFGVLVELAEDPLAEQATRENADDATTATAALATRTKAPIAIERTYPVGCACLGLEVWESNGFGSEPPTSPDRSVINDQ